MGKNRKRRGGHQNRQVSWESLQRDGRLTQRHALMAEDLGFDPAGVVAEYAGAGLLLLEWVEDRYFERFGRYVPMDESVTPEGQAENQAENSLLPDPDKIMDDYMRENGFDEDSDEWFSAVGAAIEQSERDTPVSYGEIVGEDERMLRRQANFRKAAQLLAGKLAGFAEVERVDVFGSVALPLWKEVPRFSRLRRKQVKIYHECGNIDLAVWVTSTARAGEMRKTGTRLVNELVQQEIHLNIAGHHFSMHLVDQATNRYLGMVCDYARCPADKPGCEVPGCGASPHVRILPGFRLKPERLNSHNSLVLFRRSG